MIFKTEKRRKNTLIINVSILLSKGRHTNNKGFFSGRTLNRDGEGGSTPLFVSAMEKNGRQKQDKYKPLYIGGGEYTDLRCSTTKKCVCLLCPGSINERSLCQYLANFMILLPKIKRFTSIRDNNIGKLSKKQIFFLHICKYVWTTTKVLKYLRKDTGYSIISYRNWLHSSK